MCLSVISTRNLYIAGRIDYLDCMIYISKLQEYIMYYCGKTLKEASKQLGLLLQSGFGLMDKK